NPRLARVTPPPPKRTAKRRPPPLPRQAAQQASKEPEPIMMTVAEDESLKHLKAQPRPAARGANALALHQWLTPQTMRRQFILTEILQPPLALRDSHLQ
ncbi:MAG TPA: hypothetical protein VL282_06890, partial [Tepidisphaeraceae bacterium]|nr:hypothetical protein [Tepidisphaeraceae bacterium]